MAPKKGLLAYEAGQFAFFSFAALSPRESHPFTIASAPSGENLRIIVKASGDFTSELVRAVEVGDEVRVEGAYGHLTERHCDSQQEVWVAGGIGITPFLSRAHALGDSAAKVVV